MKEIFLVNVHSFSDVITNSSTDIFACKSQKSVDAIKELLNEIATAAGESAGLTVENQTIQEFWDRTKDYCILDMGYDYVYDKWKKDDSTYGSDVTPKTKLIVICETDKEYNVKGYHKQDRFAYTPRDKRKADPELTEEKLFKEWLERHKSYFTSMEWKKDDSTYGSDVTPKTKLIVICGTDDNSIPYWLQEYIQDRLHGVRYHLG